MRILNENIKVVTIESLLKEIKSSMINKTPFSLVRFGDGGIKVIHALASGDFSQLSDISSKEGIPLTEIRAIVKLWAATANLSNYVDTPEVYFSKYFWPRIRKNRTMSQKTIKRLKLWEHLYKIAGFEVKGYCNPECNFLMCLSSYGNLSLPELLKGKNVCCITSVKDLNKYLVPYNLKFNILQISGQGKNQYKNSLEEVIKKIKETANFFDIWLIAAGELGRIYPGIIKSKGGRAIDVGSLIDFWKTGEIPVRLFYFVKKDPINKMKIMLTNRGKEYEGKF